MKRLSSDESLIELATQFAVASSELATLQCRVGTLVVKVEGLLELDGATTKHLNQLVAANAKLRELQGLVDAVEQGIVNEAQCRAETVYGPPPTGLSRGKLCDK